MRGIPRAKGVRGLICVASVILLAGCTPLYMWDTHVTATPRPATVGVTDLTREPVATLGPITPAGFQGFSPFLSRALIAAMSETSPPIRGIPTHETMNMINGQGLSTEYGELISGFVRSGILERERLQRLGSTLGSRYVLLPVSPTSTKSSLTGLSSLDSRLLEIGSSLCGSGYNSGTRRRVR